MGRLPGAAAAQVARAAVDAGELPGLPVRMPGRHDRGLSGRLARRAGQELKHDPEKWTPVFGKDHAQTDSVERDGDSKKSHHALAHAALRRSAVNNPGTEGTLP